ncbi:MAG: hypothetical protein ACW991_04315, partial [Candidatus Hodarchaeales archaeon]
MTISPTKRLLKYILIIIIFFGIIHPSVMINPIQLNEPVGFSISGNMMDARDELENVLSITHNDPT